MLISAEALRALFIKQSHNGADDPELTFRPLEPKMEAALFFAWKKYQVFSKAAEKFLETLQNLI